MKIQKRIVSVETFCGNMVASLLAIPTVLEIFYQDCPYMVMQASIFKLSQIPKFV